MNDAVLWVVALTCVGMAGMLLTGAGIGLAVWGLRARNSTETYDMPPTTETPEPSMRMFDPSDEEDTAVEDAPAPPRPAAEERPATSGRTIVAFDYDDDTEVD